MLLACAWALAAVAIASVAKATVEMVDRKGMDHAERWQELRYFLRGTDPNRVHPDVLAGLARGLDERAAEAAAGVDERLAIERRSHPIGVYPPWTYVVTAPLGAFASLPVARTCFAVLNLALFALAWVWCLREAGRVAGPEAAALAAAACMAIAAFRVNAMVGNHALLALALLLGMRGALERDRPVLGGVLFGLAMFKPVLVGPFVFVFLLRRAWWSGAFVATGTVLAACAAFAAWTGESPLASFGRTLERQATFDVVGLGVTGLVAALFGEGPEVQRLWSLAVLVAGTALLVANRRAPLATHFAICAVTALLWTFHRRYDQTLLVFVLLYAFADLVRVARAGDAADADDRGRARGLAWRTAALALLWATAFLPVGWLRFYELKFAIELYWVATLLTLLVAGGRARAARPDGAARRPATAAASARLAPTASGPRPAASLCRAPGRPTADP